MKIFSPIEGICRIDARHAVLKNPKICLIFGHFNPLYVHDFTSFLLKFFHKIFYIWFLRYPMNIFLQSILLRPDKWKDLAGSCMMVDLAGSSKILQFARSSKFLLDPASHT
jgi:hypothetical protein